MLTFAKFLEVHTDVIGRIREILRAVNALPNEEDQVVDLFAPSNKKKILIQYFDSLLVDAEGDEKLVQLLQQHDLSGEPIDVYHRINGAGHPVRDYLIVKHNAP